MLIFLLELEISVSGVAVLRIHLKTVKNDSFCEEMLSENGFEAVSANFCCYDYAMVPMLLRQFRRLAQEHWSGKPAY